MSNSNWTPAVKLDVSHTNKDRRSANSYLLGSSGNHEIKPNLDNRQEQKQGNTLFTRSLSPRGEQTIKNLPPAPVKSQNTKLPPLPAIPTQSKPTNTQPQTTSTFKQVKVNKLISPRKMIRQNQQQEQQQQQQQQQQSFTSSGNFSQNELPKIPERTHKRIIRNEMQDTNKILWFFQNFERVILQSASTQKYITCKSRNKNTAQQMKVWKGKPPVELFATCQYKSATNAHSKISELFEPHWSNENQQISFQLKNDKVWIADQYDIVRPLRSSSQFDRKWFEITLHGDFFSLKCPVTAKYIGVNVYDQQLECKNTTVSTSELFKLRIKGAIKLKSSLQFVSVRPESIHAPCHSSDIGNYETLIFEIGAANCRIYSCSGVSQRSHRRYLSCWKDKNIEGTWHLGFPLHGHDQSDMGSLIEEQFEIIHYSESFYSIKACNDHYITWNGNKLQASSLQIDDSCLFEIICQTKKPKKKAIASNCKSGFNYMSSHANSISQPIQKHVSKALPERSHSNEIVTSPGGGGGGGSSSSSSDSYYHKTQLTASSFLNIPGQTIRRIASSPSSNPNIQYTEEEQEFIQNCNFEHFDDIRENYRKSVSVFMNNNISTFDQSSSGSIIYNPSSYTPSQYAEDHLIYKEEILLHLPFIEGTEKRSTVGCLIVTNYRLFFVPYQLNERENYQWSLPISSVSQLHSLGKIIEPINAISYFAIEIIGKHWLQPETVRKKITPAYHFLTTLPILHTLSNQSLQNNNLSSNNDNNSNNNNSSSSSSSSCTNNNLNTQPATKCNRSSSDQHDNNHPSSSTTTTTTTHDENENDPTPIINFIKKLAFPILPSTGGNSNSNSSSSSSSSNSRNEGGIYTQYFAFSHKTGNKLNDEGWNIYNFENEYLRQIRKYNPSQRKWMIFDGNKDFAICSSYPREMVQPYGISTVEILSISSHRSKMRIPAVTWIHPTNGAALIRCSQPKQGWRSSKSAEEGKYFSLICSADNPVIWIMDARPQINAMANRLKGHGYEDLEHYSKETYTVRIKFLGIGNIHVMRDSLRKLQKVCEEQSDLFHSSSQINSNNTNTNNNNPDGNNTLSSNENFILSFCWFDHLKLLLKSADRIVSKIHHDGQSVVLHCSDGWDRTAQLASLAQLLMDGYFRTVKGFCVLIEKDWLSFGHKFADRTGQGDSNFKCKERSPIFLQFIECCWQLMQQQPTFFEFNEWFLIAILEHVTSGRFGTFLYNTVREREKHEVKSRTHSLWNILINQSDFLNSLYNSATLNETLAPIPNQIFFWRTYYLPPSI